MATTMAMAQGRMEAVYAARGGTKALPWAAILQAIMTLLGGCTPKAAKRFATRHPDAFKEILHDKLEGDGMIDSADVPDVVTAAHETFTGASVEDITAVWHESKA